MLRVASLDSSSNLIIDTLTFIFGDTFEANAFLYIIFCIRLDKVKISTMIQSEGNESIKIDLQVLIEIAIIDL